MIEQHLRIINLVASQIGLIPVFLVLYSIKNHIKYVPKWLKKSIFLIASINVFVGIWLLINFWGSYYLFASNYCIASNCNYDPFFFTLLDMPHWYYNFRNILGVLLMSSFTWVTYFVLNILFSTIELNGKK